MPSQMDLKQQLLSRAFKLMQDPRVAKAMQDPRGVQGVRNAMQLRAKVQQNLDQRVKRVAKGLNLATSGEVRELRRSLERLQRELDDNRARTLD